MLQPRLFSADIADWVSSSDVMYSRGLCCQKPDQVRLASSEITTHSDYRQPLTFTVHFLQCIFHKVLKEYRNTWMNGTNLNARPEEYVDWRTVKCYPLIKSNRLVSQLAHKADN